MKATEQYFPVVLFVILYKVVLQISLCTKYLSVTIQMKADPAVVIFFTEVYHAIRHSATLSVWMKT